MNHKIKINNIEVELTEEQIIELHSRLQNKGEKYFFPKALERFFSINPDGLVVIDNNDTTTTDEEIINRGVFRTEAQAKKEDEKRLALVRMWKWVQENGLYFEPDWSNGKVMKHFVSYDYECRKFKTATTWSTKTDFLFPHFNTQEDCQKFIDNNLSDLNLFV